MKKTLTAAAAIALVLAAAGAARGQCMLANPSFEVAGSGSTLFSGWSQVGTVAVSTSAAHGSRAALIAGPNTGIWDVSGVWQSLACLPGQQWSASVIVENSSAAPLTGGSAALLNIEWRDAGGNLISYESHAAADPTTPVDAWRVYSVQSGPAPAGTASIHFLLGVLQGPTDPRPQVIFDSPNCYLVGPPTHESLQWSDFPTGRTVSFSGRTWRVKGTGNYGPGPNWFDASAGAASVDALGRLHMVIRKVGTTWYSSEVALDQPLGYGDYIFTTRGRLDLLDRNTILGLFIWEYGDCYDAGYLWWNPYNEIDIEFSRWGNAANSDAQFVAQPATTGNIHRFNVVFADSEVTSHAMRWLPGRVEYRSWRGGPDAERTSVPIDSWTYTGPQLPRPEFPRVHINLWQLAAPAVTQEAVLDAFTFRPACPSGNCGVLAVPPGGSATPGTMLASAAPNPLGSRTVIRYSLSAAGAVELDVFDLSGRHVRKLAGGAAGPGEHAVEWNRLDDAGRRVPPGVYLYRLRGDGRTQAKRMVVLD